jgi:lipoprotein-anchoring transpeptidase ErfK/SrfK
MAIDSVFTRRLSRRSFVAGLPLLLAACTTDGTPSPDLRANAAPLWGSPAANYGPLPNEQFPIAALDTSKIDPQFLRQEVDFPTSEQPGTIIIDPANHFLYLTEEGGRAMRYGVGVGREGFGWSGRAIIDRKQEWPRWFPPKEMMARDPEAAKYPDGMDGGLRNPLGARALYLSQNGKDTYYRIHGTNNPLSIGKSMSSGCIRLFNHDIIDLYSRVPIGTPVVVLSAGDTAIKLGGL